METSPDMRNFIKKRTAIKSLVDNINKIMGSFNASTQSTSRVLIYLAILNDLMDFNLIQDLIMELDQGYDEDNDCLLFEENYYSLRVNMEEIIAKQLSTEATNSSHFSHMSLGDTIRLPSIQLPKFDGRLEDWASFLDTFNALFHSNNLINDV